MAASFDRLQFVITGGAGGIGRACARELLSGAEVLLDVDAARLDAATAELGADGRVKSHCSRLASPQEALRLALFSGPLNRNAPANSFTTLRS